MAIQQLPIAPLPRDGYRLADRRIRRCEFRRLTAVGAGTDRGYEVDCLYPDRRVALAIGDLKAATAVCNACNAQLRIFRPDED